MAKSHAGLKSATLPEIDRSKDYPVRLGDTFSESIDATYHSLQYKFKPKSAGKGSGGRLQIDQNTIALQTPNVQEGNPGVAFEGQWAPSQPGLDCVALFDGTSWRLELLSGLGTNLRHTGSVPQMTHTPHPQPGRTPPPDVRADGAMREGAGQAAMRATSASAPPSRTPSVAPPPSTTPSMSRHPSQETSPSPTIEPTRRPVSGQSPRVARLGLSEAPQASRGSPSVPPPNSMLEVSSSSVSTSDSDEEVVQPKAPPTQPPQAAAPGSEKQKAAAPPDKKAAAANVPDFEREFFEDNSDEEDESDGSDSSGNLSEEEAKHF